MVAQPLDYMVEVLSAANIMNANGKNSEGIEGFSEMLKELRSLVKEKLQRRSTRNTLNGLKIDQKNLGFKIKIGKSEIAEQ